MPERTILHRDLAHVANGHAQQKLDLYLPNAGTNLPLIINIHGGFKDPKVGELALEFLAEHLQPARIVR